MSIGIPQNPWQQVMIAKREEDGSLALDASGNVKETPRLLDTRTGDLYINDTIEDIRAKCLAIPFGLPVYTSLQMAWSAKQLVVKISSLATKVLLDLAKTWKETLTIGYARKMAHDVSMSVQKHLGDFVAAPFFAGAVLAAVAYGLPFPYEGRKWEAQIEHRWSGHVSYKKDVRFLGVWKAEACYLAHCFQPRGKRSNVQEEEKYVIRKWKWG